MDSAAAGRTGAVARRVLIVFASLALALIAVELGARLWLGERFEQGAWVGPPQAICGRFDPLLGWANREGTSERIRGHRVSYEVAINSVGQRGREHEREKPRGTVRVLLLGDSTAWGWGVDDEQAFAHLVEEQLEVEVINLAVPGYSTDQQVLQLERDGWAWAPDLVLLAVVHNDLVGVRHPEFHGMRKPLFTRAKDGTWTLTNSPVPEPAAGSQLAARYALRRASKWLASARLLLPKPPEYRRPDLDDPSIVARIDGYWDSLLDPDSAARMLFARLGEQCAERDVPLFAFVLPHLHDRYLYDAAAPRPEIRAPSATAPFLTHGSTQLGRAAGQLGFRAFSVDQALFEATGAGEHLDCGDEHLNARGNELVAGVIADELRETVERLR